MRARQRLAAYAVVVDDAGRVLLTQRPSGGRRRPLWSLPGGGVEHGEHPEQAVIREVSEETGLRVHPGPLCGVVSDVAVVGRRRRGLHTVRLIYGATVAQGKLDSAVQQVPGSRRWCSPQDLQALPLAPFVARVLAR